MSPPSPLAHAVRCSATACMPSWLEGGGGLGPTSLGCEAAPLRLRAAALAALCAALLTACPPSPGYAPPPGVPRRVVLARPRGAGGAQHAPWHSSAAPPNVLTLLVELVQVLKALLVGAGTDCTKCFDLIPQAISMALMEGQGIDEGIMRAFRGMYVELKRMFKIKGCRGAWWAATNGVLQGCPLSVIVINAITTTWKLIIDDVERLVVVTTEEMPPAPKEEELPSCYWSSYGAWTRYGSRDVYSLAAAGSKARSWMGNTNPRWTRTIGEPRNPREGQTTAGRGTYASGEGMGTRRAASNAHPSKHGAL